MEQIARLALNKALKKYFKENFGKVLDIGGKHRPYKKMIQKISYISLDINPNHNPDIVADIHNIHMIRNNSFDTILATEVLEHCHNPKKAVSEIYRILKKGGTAIISTPFLYPYHPDPKDYYRYTKDGLKELCIDFKEISIIPVGNRFLFMWEMLTWKIKALKLFNPILIKILDYKDENGPIDFITIAKK